MLQGTCPSSLVMLQGTWSRARPSQSDDEEEIPEIDFVDMEMELDVTPEEMEASRIPSRFDYSHSLASEHVPRVFAVVATWCWPRD